MIEDVAIKEMDKSVVVGQNNEKEIIERVVRHFNFYQDGNFVAFKMPSMSYVDYMLVCDSCVYAQVEIKVRTKFWNDTIIPTSKEVVALEDYLKKGIKTFYIAHYLDINKTLLYDLTKPPVKRDKITRKDREITSDYSFYRMGIEIK